MKKSVAVLTSLAVVMGLASAGTLTYSADAVSRYIWRGIDFGQPVSYAEPYEWQNNTPAFQPGLTYTLDNGVSVGLWGSVGVGPKSTQQLDELDLTATVPFSYSNVDYKIGYTHYTFPSYVQYLNRTTDSTMKDIVTNTDSDEVFFGVSLPKVALAPSVVFYKDYDQNKAKDDLTQYSYTELALNFPTLPGDVANSLTIGFDGTKYASTVTNYNYKVSKAVNSNITAYSNLIVLTGAKSGTGLISAKGADGKRDPINNDSYEIVFGMNYTGSLGL